MGATLHYFMLPDDERALFRLLARREVTVYPELVPSGYAPVAAAEDTPARLDLPAYYLALERLGPVVVHPVKRGPDRGKLAIEEIPSPVFHYERSLPNEDGELVAGRLWAELEVTDDPESRRGKPYAPRRWSWKSRTSSGRSRAAAIPRGSGWDRTPPPPGRRGDFKLREPGHKGRLIGVWR